jgi:hypothetical protein
VIGIVHGAAKQLPDLLDFLANRYPDLKVRHSHLTKDNFETTTMGQYYEEVRLPSSFILNTLYSRIGFPLHANCFHFAHNR